MNDEKENLRARTKMFARRIIRLYCALPKSNAAAQILGKQALRSGTSIGANYREAYRARSKAEFISKIGDCLKEAEETLYWLELLLDENFVTARRLTPLIPNAEMGLPQKNAKNTKRMASKILSSAIFGGTGFTAFVHLALRSLRSLAANFGVRVNERKRRIACHFNDDLQTRQRHRMRFSSFILHLSSLA